MRYFLLFFLLFPVPTFALDLVATGAGTAGVNGTYVASSSVGTWGAGWGINTTGQYAVINNNPNCEVRNMWAGDAGTGVRLYYVNVGAACSTTAIAAVEYTNSDGGTPPPPTFAESGGGGGGDTGGATSTIEQSQQNLSTAFFIVFVSFFGTVWLFRKHS